jgi:hypothetical protein
LADCFRAPVVTRLQAKPHLNSGFVHQSLLLTTLVAVAALPFVQKSFDNPVTRRARQYEQVGVNTRLLSARPLNQFDWPNPVCRAKTAQDHSHSVLLSTLSLAIPPAPFAQWDWHNPSRKRAVTQDHAQSNLLSTLSLTVVPPFAQGDWQNPSRRARTIQDHVHSVLGSTLSLTTVAPFAQREWTNPVRRPTRGQDWQYSVTFTTLRLVFIPPFSQTEWTNPQRQRTYLRGDVYNLLPLTTPPPAPPAPAITEVIPYVIGATEGPATAALNSIHMSVTVIGSGGTVTAQSVEAFTLADRGTTVTITMGGPINTAPSRRRAPYGNPE